MATCTRAPLPPPAAAAAAAAVTTAPGKERGAFLPELEKGKDAAILPPAIVPAVLAKPGKEMDSCSLSQEKEKPLARPAPNTATENLVNPGKKMRRPVPMTDEERNKIKELKEQHRSGMEGLQEVFQIHRELRHHHDELLFGRRCLAARLVSRIAFQRYDAAYIKHQRDLGLKLGDKSPEELKKIGPPMGAALVIWAEMGRALNIGMDNYIAECDNPEVYRGRMRSLGLIRDEKGAPQDCVVPQE